MRNAHFKKNYDAKLTKWSAKCGFQTKFEFLMAKKGCMNFQTRLHSVILKLAAEFQLFDNKIFMKNLNKKANLQFHLNLLAIQS